jgi:hypothetical protein
VRLALLRDAIEDDIRAGTDETGTGIPIFDRLTAEQKLALLAETALALRDPDVPTPHHTAANEGAIAALFATVRNELDTELEIAGMDDEEDKPTTIRRMLRAVGEESEGRDESLPDETATDAGAWEWLLEEFEGRIFWDADFAMGDEFLDLPPNEARDKLRLMGIDPEYYLAVPDEPDQAGLSAARRKLTRLLGLPAPDQDGLYPALDDLYHHLVIGPCSPDAIAAWEENPWVQVIRLAEPEWDCDYLRWSAMFGPDLPPTPFRLAPPKLESVPELPARVRAEQRGDAWVVRDEDGLYWSELIENGWTRAPDDEAMPALTFPTEAEARSAFAQAHRMYDEREKRHAEALGKLGLAEG